MDKPLEKMTLKELRRFAIDSGLGITYLSERKKDELIKIVEKQKEEQAERARIVGN